MCFSNKLQFFETPTRESGLIPDHVIVTIFSNIRQIISINTELWEHLNMLSTGAAFLQMGPFLKLYSTYANNHERALATLLVQKQFITILGKWLIFPVLENNKSFYLKVPFIQIVRCLS